MVHHVVRRPHPLVGGDGEDELGIRPKLFRDRSESGMVILDMLDDIEGADQMVMAILHLREFRQRRAHDLAPKPLLRQRAGLLVQLQPIHMAEAGKHRQVVAGAAADLENVRSIRKLRFPADQVGDDLAPSAIPPMALVQLRHLLIDYALHQPKTH